MWISIKGLEGKYEANENGQIRTLNYKGSNGRIEVFKPAKDAKGYLRTALVINGKAKTIKVHRVIAETFVSNPLNKPQVNHINGVKDDNRAENLEWVTNRENVVHAYENNLVNLKSGESHHRSKYSNELIEKAYSEYLSGTPKRELARKYGFSRSVFRRVGILK